MAREYNAESIEVLSGLDPVKKRPGMYTETSRPNHLALEVIDNSIDEALAGHATSIDVELHKDGSLSVEDDGRGMPVGIHPDEGIPAVELIFTRLHAGAKFSDEDYKFSGGLHGVGLSVVNSLSEELIVEVNRDKNLWRQEFSKGMPKTKIKKIKESSKKGTYIEFIPDKEIFGNDVNFDAKILKQMAESKAYLFRGITINWELDTDDSKNNEKITITGNKKVNGIIIDHSSNFSLNINLK